MSSYKMQQFQAKLQRAMESVRKILDATRQPCFAADVHHQYQDKFILAQAMTNAAAASQLNALISLGLTQDELKRLCTWSKTNAVSLQFRAEEKCEFVNEVKREVESPEKHVTEVTMAGRLAASMTSKVLTTVTEYVWKYEASYELSAINGVGGDPESRISIQKRVGTVELKTSGKASPHPASTVPAASYDVNITWLINLLKDANIDEGVVPKFAINRDHPLCHTPRRNPQVLSALDHFRVFAQWTADIEGYLGKLLRVQPDEHISLDIGAVSAAGLFIPVLPLLNDQGEQSQPEGADDGVMNASCAAASLATLARVNAQEGASSLTLCVSDMNSLLSAEKAALDEKQEQLKRMFPESEAVATSAEAVLAVTLKHCSNVCSQWGEAVDYIEDMLRKQLIAAIGKEVQPADLAEYMQFHNRRLFKDDYAPVPFCFAVRRSDDHSPEGTVSIEQEITGGGGDSNIPNPIVTVFARGDREHAMDFPLSASTSVTFKGDKYLHAWLQHQFSGQTGAKLSLVSRARQFSSMLVVVGRIASARSFDPKYAAIVQNKDELKIPLDLSTIPTPKEFKDAIESLSPEQQAFAKAFRSMQLESTLFGVLVIQIKPQLEKVLNLPKDSLTKEIKLTQDLMQLFIKYQIPSDLVAFDVITDEGFTTVNSTTSDKLDTVKAHVKAMNEMIEHSQQEEIAQRKMEAQYARPQVNPMPCAEGSMYLNQVNAMMMPAPCPPPMASMGYAAYAAPARGMAMAACAPQTQSLDLLSDFAPMGAGMAMASCAPQTQSLGFSLQSDFAPRGAAAGGGGASEVFTSAPPPRPNSEPQAQPQPQPQQENQTEKEDSVKTSGRDYTQVPSDMDKRFEKFDEDSQLRPTIITPKGDWTKRAQKALLANPTTNSLGSDAQKKEKDAAFDLLDALTKSGALDVEHATLHIVVAATHCFDKTVTETVVQDNVNPIDKVERSTLIMATTVHQQPDATALIRDAHKARVRHALPGLCSREVSMVSEPGPAEASAEEVA